jgi:hypothetical protein
MHLLLWFRHCWRRLWKSPFGMAAVVFSRISSTDANDGLRAKSWASGRSRYRTERDLENSMGGISLERGSSTRNSVLRGKFDKARCYGAGCSCFFVFLVCSAEWHPSSPLVTRYTTRISPRVLQGQTVIILCGVTVVWARCVTALGQLQPCLLLVRECLEKQSLGCAGNSQSFTEPKMAMTLITMASHYFWSSGRWIQSTHPILRRVPVLA